MYQRDVQALPVVDDKEAIVTTLSTSDTKGIDAQNITSCLLPVLGLLIRLPRYSLHLAQYSMPVQNS